jgi:hypothetical protein
VTRNNVATRTPDKQHRIGEPRLTRSPNGVVNEYTPYNAGVWAMSSEQSVDSPRLETHLKWLLDELEPRIDAMGLAINDLNIDFFCFSMGASASPPSIPRAILERANRLGIRIETNHYDSTNNESVA